MQDKAGGAPVRLELCNTSINIVSIVSTFFFLIIKAAKQHGFQQVVVRLALMIIHMEHLNSSLHVNPDNKRTGVLE